MKDKKEKKKKVSEILICQVDQDLVLNLCHCWILRRILLQICLYPLRGRWSN